MKTFKEQVVELIHKEKERLGSYSAVANKCEVSEATISQIVSGKYNTANDSMFEQIAHSLGLEDGATWNISTETNTFKTILKLADTARKKCMYIPISEKAGIGKSAPLKYYSQHMDPNSFYIRCREWGKKDFLKNLCKVLGVSYPSGYASHDEVSEVIFEFFSKKRRKKPLLIVDEADKLKPAALRFFITLFNELEDKLAVIISGTENLEKEIKRGVRYAVKGYDELDSRFGRNFFHIAGAPLADVRKICEVNGITDQAKQKELFDECKPVTKQIEERDIKVVEDLRRLKRVIQRELLINAQNEK